MYPSYVIYIYIWLCLNDMYDMCVCRVCLLVGDVRALCYVGFVFKCVMCVRMYD